MKEFKAFKRLLDDYTDYFGRTCLYNKSKSNPVELKYDSENQHLFTGITGVFAKHYIKQNLISQDQFYQFKLNVKMVLDNTKIRDGLYARQPEPYVLNEGHSMSHDEHNGMMFYLASINANSKANELVEYGQKHSWAYIEEEPYLDPMFYVKQRPVDEFKRLMITLFNFLRHKGTHESNKSYLTRITLPETRGLMKIVAENFKPTLFEVLNMTIASIMSSSKPKQDTSSKIMTFNKFKVIEFTGFKSKLLDFARKRFHKKMVKMYGDNYYQELISIYYLDENHPFRELSDKFTL